MSVGSVALPPRFEGRRLPGIAAAVAVAAAIGVAAVVLPSVAVILVAGPLFTVIVFRSPALGLAIFTALIFFSQILGSGLSGIKVAGLLLTASWLLRVLRSRGAIPFLGREHPAVAAAIVGFGLWLLASALWAEDAHAAVSNALRIAQGLLLVFVVVGVVTTKQQLRWVIAALVVGAFVTSLLGVAGGTSSDAVTATADEANRLSGQIGDPNNFAAVLVPAFVIAAFGLTVARTPLTRLFLGVAAALFAIALFLTESRGGIVALGVSLVVSVVFAGPVRARAVAISTSLGAVAFAYFVFVAPPEALTRITHFSAGGGAGRTDLWSVALKMFGAHPVNGIGAGNFPIVEPRYAASTVNLPRVDLVIDTPKVAHNTYLHVLTETGIVGLALFLVLLAGTLLAGVRAARAAAAAGDLELEVIARGIVIGTVGMLAAFTFLSAQAEKQLWLMLGLVLALTALARRAQTEALEARDYDPAVEELVGSIERRVEERIDALVAEHERLAARRAQTSARERELRELDAALRAQGAELEARVRALEERERALGEPQQQPVVDEHAAAATAELEQRERQLEQRIEALTARERELARETAELAAARSEIGEREGQLRERLRVVTERELALARATAGRAAAAAAAPALPAPPVVPPVEREPPAAAPTEVSSRPTLDELERLVDRHGAEQPEREEEWRSYLFFLRDYVDVDGRVPASFDGLLEDVFGDLLP